MAVAHRRDRLEDLTDRAGKDRTRPMTADLGIGAGIEQAAGPAGRRRKEAAPSLLR